MADYHEMYLHLARATEQAIRILIAAQQEAEGLYLSSTDSKPDGEPLPTEDPEDNS